GARERRAEVDRGDQPEGGESRAHGRPERLAEADGGADERQARGALLRRRPIGDVGLRRRSRPRPDEREHAARPDQQRVDRDRRQQPGGAEGGGRRQERRVESEAGQTYQQAWAPAPHVALPSPPWTHEDPDARRRREDGGDAERRDAERAGGGWQDREQHRLPETDADQADEEDAQGAPVRHIRNTP